MPARIAFTLGVLWIVYVYAGYPLILSVLSWFIRRSPKTSGGYFPTVSVLIAARNEEKDIVWKVRQTLDWDYPPDRLEILVASDASEDRTDELVAALGDPRVTLIRMEKRGGKIRALNRMAQQAKGEILFFTDANASIGEQCLRHMVRHFIDERVGCVTGDSRSIEQDGNVVGDGATVYWSYESLLKRLENSIGSVLVCDGAIFCSRRKLYAPLLPELANDMETPMRIAASGHWVLHEPQAIAIEKDTSSPWEEFMRRRRICGQGALGMWKLRDTMLGLRGWEFVSHKLLRWLTLIPLVLIFFSSASLAAAHPIVALCFMLQVVFYGMALAAFLIALAGGRIGTVLATPFYVVLGCAGAFAGVIETCWGRRFDIWEIPTLSRGRRASS
jgi:biofilm PGA synthesis N-glycosyltransferase PgaC